MADGTKHNIPINGGMITDLKSLFPVIKTRKTLAFAYGFMFAFVCFTIFLAFNPTSYENSYFTNIFTTTSSKTGSVESNRSQFGSIVTYFFNSTQQSPEKLAPFSPAPSKNTTAAVRSQNTTVQQLGTQNSSKVPIFSPPTQKTEDSALSGVLKPNHTAAPAIKPPPAVNRSGDSNSVNLGKGSELKGQENANYSASLSKKQNHGSDDENLVKSLMNCDLFDGNWVKDESYPLYKPGSCSFIDEQFNCINNGRPDKDYHKFKWKPKACTLPRLNASHLLKMLKGKRLVFVGDSLNRNMWESLVCILKSAVKDQSKVYEAQGRHHFRGEASYSFIFKDYNCTVEFFVSPFLVQEWEMPEKGGKTKETLRLDLVGRSSDQYKSADIIIFNTGHWWTHDKTAKGKDYYQEGSHVYGELNVLEAFRKALTTWARWVDTNVHPEKSWVFFRGYSASHFSGGQWNSGGACDNETLPIDDDKYLTPYPPKMLVLEKVFEGMKTHISYLNVTRLTDYRKDGHPSVYRKKQISEKERRMPLLYQDCSHWCLPGVPDAWNEILYAELLIKQYEKLHRLAKVKP